MFDTLQRLTSAVANNLSLYSLIDISIRIGCLMLLATLAVMLLRKSSAAVRHLVWASAFFALLLLPVFSLALPEWQALPNWSQQTIETPVDIVPEPVVEEPADVSAFQAESLPQNSFGMNTQPEPIWDSEPVEEQFVPAAAPIEEVSSAASLVPVSAELPTAITATVEQPQAATTSQLPAWIFIAWAIGCGLLFCRLIASRLILGRLVASAAPVAIGPIADEAQQICEQLGIRRAVNLYQTGQRETAMTWGLLRTYVLLPAAASSWSARRLRTVLLHELAHVKQYDTVTHVLSQVVCALYWFHPLVWLAAWRLHVEREQACDNRVLQNGVKASDYAEDLLSLLASRTVPCTALAIARRSELEGRLRAIVGDRVNRRGLNRAALVGTLIVGLLSTSALAMLQPKDEAARLADETSESLAPVDLAPANFATAEAGSVELTLGNENKVDLRSTVEPVTEVEGKQTVETVAVHCVDEKGKPVAGAEVYLFQHDGEKYQQFGPFTSDDEGKVDTAPKLYQDKLKSFSRFVYARVPGKLVGVIQKTSERVTSSRDEEIYIRLWPSRSIDGQVIAPDGFDPTQVTVGLRSMVIGNDLNGESVKHMRYWLLRHSEYPGIDTALPEIFETHPDSTGKCQLHDIPAKCDLTLISNGAGLAHTTGDNRGERFDKPIQLTNTADGILSGKVFTPDGKPADGVRVMGPTYYIDSEQQCITDDEGQFMIRGLHGRPFRLMIYDPKQRWIFHTDEEIDIHTGEHLTLAVRMQNGVIISGRVVDTAGQPVKGAKVLAHIKQGEADRYTGYTADTNGHYQVCVPAGCKVELKFEKIPMGYARPYPKIVKQLEIKADQKDVKDLNFTLQRAVDLKVKPKPNLRQRSGRRASARPAKQVGKPAQQPTELVAQADETPGKTGTSKSSDGSTPKQKPSVLDTISGTVVLGAANKPVAGATVTLRRRPFRFRPKSLVLATATTDERGQFTFKNVPLPENKETSAADRSERVYPLDLVVTKPGHSIRWKRLARGQANAQIKLRRESTFAGILKDETGQPVPNATVRVAHIMSLNTISKIDVPHGHTPNENGDSFLNISDGPIGIQATTDGNGRFLLRDLPRRVGLILQVNDKRYMPLKIYAATTDEKLPQISIAASNSRADRSTAAAIMTERGRKVTYATIHASGATHHIQRGVRLTVKVVDAQTGQPVEKAGVYVANEQAMRLSGVFKDYPTAEDGTVEFYQQTKGPLNVVVKAPDGSTFVGMTEVIDLSSAYEFPGENNEIHYLHTIKLEHGSVVTGKIVDAETGEGVHGAQVYCNLPHHHHPEDDNHDKPATMGPIITGMTSANTDEQGNYRIVVPTGRNHLRLGWLPKGYQSAKPDPDDPHRQTTVMLTAKDRQPISDINFEVTRKQSFRVDFVGPDGQPVAATVTGKGLLSGGYRQSVKTDSQPTTSFMYFPDERTKTLRLIARSADDSLAAMTHFKDVKTSGSQHKMQLFRVASVTGVVTNENTGKPIEGASVSLSIRYDYRSGQGVARVKTDAEGRYEFKGLIPNARYSLGFQLAGYESLNSIHTKVETKPGEAETADVALEPSEKPVVLDIKPLELPDLAGLSAEEALKKLTTEYDKRYKEYRSLLKNQKNKAARKQIAEMLNPAMVYPPGLMKLANDNKATDVELQALLWLCETSFRGEASPKFHHLKVKAAARVMKDYSDRSEIADAVSGIIYALPERYEAAQRLMKSPHAKVQTQAYFTAAKMLAQRYHYYGKQEKLRLEAIKYYKKVAADDAGISHWQYGTLGEFAKRKLFSLEHLIVGKKAPELKGVDLAGQPMKLADFRGKVVLISYWQGDMHSFNHLEYIQKKNVGKPLAVIGVNGDKELSDAVANAKKLPIQVRHWHDPNDEISSRWTTGWPTTQVIGHDGTIRMLSERGSYGSLEDAVDKALAAMEVDGPAAKVSSTATSSKKIDQTTVAKPTDAKSADTSIAFTCVDHIDRPVAGAEVYVFQLDGKRFKQFGPFKSDDKGRVADVPEMLSDKTGSFDRWVYARVPGKLVGLARSSNWKNGISFNKEGKIRLQSSQTLKGRISVPEGHDASAVAVRVKTLWSYHGPEMFDYDSWPRSHLFPGLDTALTKIFECQAKADGSFQLTDIPVRTRVFLETTGPQLAEAQWNNKGQYIKGKPEISLAVEGVIAGRVLSPEGQPLANVEVGARISDSGRLRLGYSSTFRTFTNDKGEYRLEHLPETEVHLYAKAEGQAVTFRPLQDLLAKPGETLDKEIRMERGTILRGAVTDNAGNPVQHAAISAVAEKPIGIALDHCQTDAEGKYEMRVPAGIINLYFNSLPKGFEYPNPQAFKTFDAEPDEAEINGLDVTLQRKGEEKKQAAVEKSVPTVAERQKANSLSFTCIDHVGDPVIGAEVYVYQHDGQGYQQFGPFTSDEKGQVADIPEMLLDIAGSFDRWVYARVPGKLVGVARSSNWDNGISHNILGKVSMQPSHTVQGRVVVPDGTKPEKVKVWVPTLSAYQGPGMFDRNSRPRSFLFPDLDMSTPRFYECRPDSDGRFQLSDIPVGMGDALAAVGPGLAETHSYKKDREEAQLELKPEGVITGRVLLPDGKPAAGVQVGLCVSDKGQAHFGYLWNYQTRTNAVGEYSLRHIPETEVHICARHPNNEYTFQPVQNQLAKSGQTLKKDLQLERGIVIRGVVRDAAGQPVHHAALSVIPKKSIGVNLDYSPTDAEGKYEMRVPAGVVKLQFDALPRGYEYPGPRILKTFVLEAGQADITNLNFTLQRRKENKKQSKLETEKKPTQRVSQRKSQSPKEKEAVVVSKAATVPNSILVRCVDEKNDPVAGAEVYVFQHDGKRYQQFGPFKSDDKGQVANVPEMSNDDLGSLDRWIYARVPGRLVGATASARNGNEDVFNAGGRVEMWPSRTVSGSLNVPTGFDATKVTIQIQSLIFAMDQDGQPRGSFARILYPGLKDVLPTIFDFQPDAKGHFQLNDVPINGQLFLTTVGKGLGEAQWKNEGTSFGDPIQLAVKREALLTGVVRTPDGKPISGVNVSANLSYQGPAKVLFATTFSSRSDENGRFTIHGLPESKVTVTVEDPGKRWVIRPRQNLLVQPGEQTAMSVNLEDGALVSGQVFDADGNPLKRTSLWAGTVAEITALLGRTTTDDNGHYQIRLPSGKATLRLSDNPDVYQSVDIKPYQGVLADVNFTLQRNELINVFEPSSLN